jgi:prolyl-tRNA synthetase
MRAESGPIGGDYAHEFLILASTGETQVHLDQKLLDLGFRDRAIDYDDKAQIQGICDEWTGSYARTDDTHDQSLFEREVPEGRRVSARGIEVGHIFYFGTKYSEPLSAVIATPEGEKVPIHGGSYGIGVSRLVAGIIEASHDDKGIIWPEAVTPFHVGLVNLKQGDAAADGACLTLYRELVNAGLDVLYDDRDERAGAKFATMELIGIPWRITIGPRGLNAGVVELTSRRTGETVELSPDAAVDRMVGVYQGL